jgi:hypothetical protein
MDKLFTAVKPEVMIDGEPQNFILLDEDGNDTGIKMAYVEQDDVLTVTNTRGPVFRVLP